jgi:hypothetical protein
VSSATSVRSAFDLFFVLFFSVFPSLWGTLFVVAAGRSAANLFFFSVTRSMAHSARGRAFDV